MALHLDLNTVVQLLIVSVLLSVGRTFWRLSSTMERLAGRFEEHSKADEAAFQTINSRLDAASIARSLDRP